MASEFPSHYYAPTNAEFSDDMTEWGPLFTGEYEALGGGQRTNAICLFRIIGQFIHGQVPSNSSPPPLVKTDDGMPRRQESNRKSITLGLNKFMRSLICTPRCVATLSR